MTILRDVLYIKTLERRLRRPLSEDEMDGQPFMARFPDGHYEECRVPYYNFPYDLMLQPTYEEETPYTTGLLSFEDAA